MAVNIPPPPSGFSIDQQSLAPPPPDGFTLDGQAPKPYSGQVDAPEMFVRGQTAGVSDYVDALARYTGDKLASGLASMGVTRRSGAPITAGGMSYNDELKGTRADVSAYRDANPATAYGAEIAGGVTSPVFGMLGKGVNAAVDATANAVPSLANILKARYMGYGLQGATAGAAAGAGNAQSQDGGIPTLDDVGSSAGTGALMGGALGVAVPAVAEAGSWGAGKLRDSAQGMLDSMTGNESSAAGRRLAKAANLEGMTPDQVRAAVNQMGPDATIADTGKYFRSLAESAANQSPAAMGQAEGLGARQEGQAERIQAAALQAAGVPSKDAAIANRATQAGPLYQQAFAPVPGAVTTNSPQVTSPFIENMLEQPESQKGLQEGMDALRRDSVITGQKLDPNDYALRRNPDSGQWEKIGTPNLRTLDAVSRGYGIMLDSDTPDMVHMNTGTPTNKARQIAIMKNMFDSEIESQLPKVPGTQSQQNPQGISMWGLARQKWADLSKPIEALNTIDKVVGNANDASDITNRLYGSPANRAKLQGLTQDPQAMQQFQQQLATEKAYAQTKNQVLGSSRTGYRNAMAANDQTDFGGIAVSAAKMDLPGFASGIIRKLGSMLTAPPEGVAAQLSPLTSSDRAQQDVLLNLMRQKAQAGMGGMPGRLMSQMGQAPGALVGPLMATAGGSNQ